MTTNELKKIFDAHILNVKGLELLVISSIYHIAKYSCTEDEKDFKFINGKVLYKGFEVKNGNSNQSSTRA